MGKNILCITAHKNRLHVRTKPAYIIKGILAVPFGHYPIKNDQPYLALVRCEFPHRVLPVNSLDHVVAGVAQYCFGKRSEGRIVLRY